MKIIIAVILVFSQFLYAQVGKYGGLATPLSKDYKYIKENPAPDFWAFVPFYIAQQDDKSCSLATATMVVNAARGSHDLTIEDKLATQKDVYDKVNDPIWIHGLGPEGRGVSLFHLRELIEKSLKAYGVENFETKLTYVTENSAEAAELFHQALVENEASAKNFIVMGFDQGVFTQDTHMGHFSPIGAYDEKNKRVLIFDSDRKWYEPYWVSEKTALEGMVPNIESGNFARGYITVSVR